MSEEPVSIRRLTSADAALFRDVRLEGLRHDPDAFSSTVEDEGEKPLSFFARWLANSAVFAAFRDEEPLGVAGHYIQPGPKHAHKGMLWGMYVRPHARSAGIGARLMAAVLDQARGRVELIQLRVISENTAARRLYERFGFEEYGVERHAAKYRGRYHDDVLMALMLNPGDALAADPPGGERTE